MRSFLVRPPSSPEPPARHLQRYNRTESKNEDVGPSKPFRNSMDFSDPRNAIYSQIVGF